MKNDMKILLALDQLEDLRLLANIKNKFYLIYNHFTEKL
jgi:hypothetical protein